MLLKLTFVGGLAVAGLIAAAGYAKADVLRVNVAPAAVAPAPAPFVRDWAAPVRVAPVRADDHRGPQRHNVRLDVRQGVVYPPALASLAAHREELERDLAFASAKGYITVDDRARLERRVQNMRDLRVQFRRAHERRVTYLR